MKLSRLIKLTCSILLLVSIGSNAGLINRGSGMIYDDVLDITWLQNANLSGSLLNWSSSTQWASDLTYGGYDDWRLPTLTPFNSSNLNNFNSTFSFNGTTDRGFNTVGSNSELAYMFHSNLNNISFFSPSGSGSQPGSEVFNSSFIDADSGVSYSFENIQTSYWTNIAHYPITNAAWGFNFRTFNSSATGEQQLLGLSSDLAAWAVRDGDVASTLTPTVDVPEPSTLAIFALSIIGLTLSRAKKA